MAQPSNLPHKPTRTVPKSSEPLLESDLIYLTALLDDPTNRDSALKAAGHVLGSDDAKRSMHSKIMQRIDQADNIADLFRQIGLGPSKLAIKLNWLYAQDNARAVGLAAKIHMDVLTADQMNQSQGTPIQVNVMQNNVPATEQNHFVSVSIDARKPGPPQGEDKKV